MVKSVDHESNTGSYVLCGSGVADIFLVLIPARFKYLSPMAAGRAACGIFWRMLKSVDHKCNNGSYVRWMRDFLENAQVGRS
jgi:hypothetical protein